MSIAALRIERKTREGKPFQLLQALATAKEKAAARERETQHSTDSRKIIKINQAMTRLVVVPQDFQHLCLFQIKAQGAHGDFELMVVETPVLIGVEQFKGLFDFLLLFVRKLWTGVGAPFGFLGC